MTYHVRFAAAALFVFSSASLAQNASKPITRADFLGNTDKRFSAADTNHDGKLSREEVIAQQDRDLQQARAGLTQKFTAEFNRLDANHDGKLSLQEFLAGIPPIHNSETADQVMQRLDTNHDGKITAEEFRAPQVKQFNDADTNHDGIVSPAEAQAYAKAHAPKP